MEKNSIILKSQINNKVDNSVFDDMINESKKKLETFKSNLSCLRSEVDNLQLKHSNLMTSDDVISNDSPGYDPEIPNLSISSQVSKCVNGGFERANNVIVFNLKEQVNKIEDDKLVESLIIFIIGHSTTFKCTRLGKKESITRPVKVKFHHFSVKNEFMHHLSKLKNAPSEFNYISIKHDMTPDERSKEKELYLKAKDLNNDSLNLSKKRVSCSERTCVGQKNCESKKNKKFNQEHGKHQLKIWYTNTDVFTMKTIT